jgi:putative inorganic carbon (hco3(-)) transporter
MIVLIPIGLMRARHEGTLALRLSALGCTALVAAGSALTFSRGGAVGLLATLLIMCAAGHLRLVHLGLVLAGLALVLVAFPQWNERISSIERSVPAVLSRDTSPFEADGATLGRVGANIAALYAFADHPIVGLGPGLFNLHYRQYAIEAGYRVHDGTRATHNIYPEILAETGALGFVCIVAIVAMTLRELHEAARQSRRPRRRSSADTMHATQAGGVAAGFLFALVAYLTTGFFLSLSYQRYFWLLLALGATASAVALGKAGFSRLDVRATAELRAAP